jgi:hypothetical protein
MIDPTPDNTNRIAHFLGYLFHPFVLFVPSALIVLRGIPLAEVLGWIGLIAVITIAPTAGMIYYLRTHDKPIYRREYRLPVYATAWASTLVCGVILLLLDAPERLLACTAAIAVWVPLQTTINEYYTKISGHAAFSMGVMVGLWILGELDTWVLKGIAIAVVVFTAWARHITKHHTASQIVLGWLVAAVSVGVSFWLIL